MHPRRLCRSAIALCLFGTLSTCATLKVYRIRKLTFPNKAVKLHNGLRVVIQPDADVPYVMALMRYDVGAANDPPPKKGLAHLVEHLAFRLGDELIAAQQPAAAAPGPAPASDPAADEASAKAEAANVRILKYIVGENAYTTTDETVYWKRTVPAHLWDVLQAYADQMGDFTNAISDGVFKTEREVVRNERRSRYEGHPLDRVTLDLYDRFYPPGHPYQGHAVIGSHESIAAIERADVAEFLADHYHAGNATLAIVGPVDAEETLAMVLKLFGRKPKRELSTVEVPPWQPTNRKETIVVPNAGETMVTVAWPLGPEFSTDVEAMRILRDRGWFWYRSRYTRPPCPTEFAAASPKPAICRSRSCKRILSAANSPNPPTNTESPA